MNLGADQLADHQALNVVDGLDRNAVQLDDQVLRPQAGLGGRAALDDLHHLDTASAFEPRRNPRRQRPSSTRDPEVGTTEAPIRHQRADDRSRRLVDRHREPEAHPRDSGVDADHAAVSVRERAAGVPGVQSRVGPSAETTPAVTEPAKPFGLPIATTSCPTRRRSASPSSAGLRSRASTRSNARSDIGSDPTTSNSSSRPSTNDARPPSVRSITCAEVSVKPSGVITTALPPPSSRRPPRTRRETRRLATEGVSRSATAMTAFE